MRKTRHLSFSHCAANPGSQPGFSGLRVRSDLHSGGFQGCMGYCAQEFNRCLTSGLPQNVCSDRLPVCQNACYACGSSPF
ncbi:MAG: hypothetical protein M5U05_14075 [Anaerolineales bacterium]|nr:hypothetical protein [Anaerolineales bacterium]